ncbi:hypothetical protein TFLX_04753 [Thermoflexales bacterium]|nr:hypothetical protein TFLX_04753 [Thermoflexales bacterium]
MNGKRTLRTRRWIVWALITGLLLALVGKLTPPPVNAATQSAANSNAREISSDWWSAIQEDIRRTVLAIPYTVNSTNDVDDGACNSTHCSLREAIIAANTHAGADTIAFNISGAGVHSIAPLTALPPLIDDSTIINGYSQPGAEPATNETPATILIEVDGTNTTNQSGLVITSTNNVIRGLAVNRFDFDGIGIGYATATGNVVAGNHLGIDPQGMIDRGNGHSSVFVGLGATNNTVGGDEPAERNVLSGNGWAGVEIHGSGTVSNTISGNYIGTAASGMAALGNALYGVRIYGGAQNNIVGGDRGSATTLAKRNVISGNGVHGVHLAGEDTSGNTVAGNHIGTTVYGIAAIGNSADGVYIALGAHDNIIGGDSEKKRNVISGNLDHGVYLTGTTTMSNTIFGNYIGTDANGIASLSNEGSGVVVRGGAQHNIIGGNAIGQWNIISGNQDHGIHLSDVGTIGNLVRRNLIGTDATGTTALGNASCGVLLDDGASESMIWFNVASANLVGICLSGATTMSNTILGNYIGTNLTTTTALSNTLGGVYLTGGTHHNIVGDTSALLPNVISGNGGSGVIISGTGTMHNTLLHNLIGRAVDGFTRVGNAENGVLIAAGAQNNIVGPENIIVDSTLDGVAVEGSDSYGNRITQNHMRSNTLGIRLLGGANGGIAAPVITTVTMGSDPVTIQGTACAGCTVEVFGNMNDDGEGHVYLGSAVATGGNFNLTEDSHGLHYLTATATDATLGTSEFSTVYKIPYGVYLPLIAR